MPPFLMRPARSYGDTPQEVSRGRDGCSRWRAKPRIGSPFSSGCIHYLLRDWGWEPFATIDVGDELDHQDSGRVYRFGEGFDGDFEYVSFDDAALASMFRFRVYRWSARGRWLGVRLGSGVLSVVVYWILRILLFIYLVIGLPVALVLTL